MKQDVETHPWKWFAPKGCTILIAGTFPTAKHNWSYDFFYPNKRNLFWNVMASIADEPLKFFSNDAAVEERKNILNKLKIAVTDMGYKIIRNDNSSLDEKLSVVVYMDIFKILKENPQINKIIFTSSSGNASAAKWFSGFLKIKKIQHKFPRGDKPVRSQFVYENSQIELTILYSTSPRAANRISFDKLVEMYRNEIIQK